MFRDRAFKRLSGSIQVSIDGTPVAKVYNGIAKRNGSNPGNAVKIEIDERDPTLFPIASVTKTFTAALVWQRIFNHPQNVEFQPETKIANFIKFNDPEKFPKQAAFWNSITVGELLEHTSKLGDHVDSGKWAEAYSEPWTVDQIIDYVQHLGPRLPNSRNEGYSNAGYTILAHILESPELNGGVKREFGDLLESEILEPLGLSTKNGGHGHTGVLEDVNLLDDHRPFALPKLGADFDTKDVLRVRPMFLGSGDMYSTAEDLDTWAVDLFVKRIAIHGDVTRLWTSPPSAYHRTLGSYVIPIQNGCYHVVYKTGHFGKMYANVIAYVPEYNVTIAVLQNGNTIGPLSRKDSVLWGAVPILDHTIKLIEKRTEARQGRLP